MLVNEQTMVRELHLTGKEHHTGENLGALFTEHVLVALFAANEGSGVKAEVRKSHLDPVVVQLADQFGSVLALVVKHHADDVKA